jgi:hypothetical protein
MLRRMVQLAVMVSLAFAGRAQDLPPGTLLLARLQTVVRKSLEHLPDCTCTEVVTRYHTVRGRKEMQLADTLRLQILFSGDHELYAEPGSSKWEQHPKSFVDGGLIGDGTFALYLRAIFVNGQATFTYRGEGMDLRPGLGRFDFRIPQIQSGYTLSTGGATATVGLKGVIWVDPSPIDLVRLEMQAEDIPPALLLREVGTYVDYSRVRIGSTDVLLPQQGELHSTDILGRESRDVIVFTDCRAFQTDSSMHFEPGASTPAAKER